MNTSDFASKEFVPEIDMKARIRLMKSKNQAVKKNPNLFLSETRLCIRNLPKDYTAKSLRALINEQIIAWSATLNEEKR